MSRHRSLRHVVLTLLFAAAAYGAGSFVPRMPWSAPAPSAAAATGARLVVYSGLGFTGRALEVTGTLADLPVEKLPDGSELDWNDAIRSVRVLRGAWRFHENGRLNRELDDTPLEALDLASKAAVPGWCCLLSATSAGALEIAAPELGGFGFDVSSIELVSEENLPDWAAP